MMAEPVSRAAQCNLTLNVSCKVLGPPLPTRNPGGLHCNAGVWAVLRFCCRAAAKAVINSTAEPKRNEAGHTCAVLPLPPAMCIVHCSCTAAMFLSTWQLQKVYFRAIKTCCPTEPPLACSAPDGT